MAGLGAAAAIGVIPCWNGEAYIGCGMWVKGKAELNELARWFVDTPGSDGNNAVVPRK
jgi:hypothetical protein